jgi:acetylornithine deacetylase/succinyl-diaminopimelate desuccinylase-like protein
MLQAVLSKIDATQAETMGFLFELLRFKSIGTDPAFAADCRACAHWLKAWVEARGFAADLRETTGQPLLLASWGAERKDLPHVLFYGHYDVQPVDPLILWESPPFDPRLGQTVRGAKAIFARGATDDKGQVMTFLTAATRWLEVVGELPFRLTVILEGDEEGDSEHLDRFLKAQGKALSADIAMVCDTEMWDNKTPAVTTSLRGCIAEELTISAARIDLHSGYFGGPATNPLKVLSALIAKVHDHKGRIAIPGFYDGVRLPSAARRAGWKKLGLGARRFLGEVGLKTPAGEHAFTLAEQIWARPTVEVNGLWGGYTAEGRKTVLPAEAHAKISFRLVDGQNPAHVRKAFRSFIKKNLPKDCRASFTASGGDSTGISIEENSPWVKMAAAALRDEWGVKAAIVGSGVSIPVVECFRKHQKMESLLVGFSRFDDAAHSPNEKYDVESFHKGARSWARLFAEIAERKWK